MFIAVASSTIADLSQAAAAAVVAVVTVLAFLKAKDTVLQPQRTEIFRLQLDAARRIIALFGLVNDIRRTSGLDRSVELNGLNMIIEASKHNGSVLPDKMIEEVRAQSRSQIIRLAAFSRFMTLPSLDQDAQPGEGGDQVEEHDESQILPITVSPETIEFQKSIDLLLLDPTMNSQVGAALEAFKTALHNALLVIGDANTEFYVDLKRVKVADPKSLSNALSVHSNSVNGRLPDLVGEAGKVISEVRRSFALDLHIDPRTGRKSGAGVRR